MGDYFFGLHSGHLTEQADQIADRHGAYHENYTEPDGRKRGWFGCPNRGVPFDQAIGAAVLADIDAAGGFDALREGATSPAPGGRRMIVNVGRGEAYVRGADGDVSSERFTLGECAELADMLERMNVPGNTGTPLRRLTDMLWALQNDTSAFIIYSDD